MKRVTFALIVAGVVWYAPTAHATWQPHDTTSTTTTTTTEPSTTVPETTVPETVPTIPNGCGEGFEMPCPPIGSQCEVFEMDIVCTTPPETIPETTPLETTAPTPTVGGSAALTDVCLQHITGGPTLQPGEYVYVETWAEATGTTEKFVGLCAPTTTTAAVAPSLPATGGETGWIALVALVTLLTGISVVGTVRRSS
jgi:LPXTG-motif cell wall-anchored protein